MVRIKRKIIKGTAACFLLLIVIAMLSAPALSDVEVSSNASVVASSSEYSSKVQINSSNVQISSPSSVVQISSPKTQKNSLNIQTTSPSSVQTSSSNVQTSSYNVQISSSNVQISTSSASSGMQANSLNAQTVPSSNIQISQSSNAQITSSNVQAISPNVQTSSSPDVQKAGNVYYIITGNAMDNEKAAAVALEDLNKSDVLLSTSDVKSFKVQAFSRSLDEKSGIPGKHPDSDDIRSSEVILDIFSRLIDSVRGKFNHE